MPSGGVTVTCGAANVKGAYTQAWASTKVDSGEIIIQPDDVQVSATNTSTLIDIAVGAAGSEVVVIANINIGMLGHGTTYRFPIFIPAGTRVSIRGQSAVASKALIVRANLIPCSLLADAAMLCETVGAVTASSIGTALPTAAGVAGTKTAWTQLVAACANRVRWVSFSLGCAGTNVAASKGGVDIGYGAAGSEVVLLDSARLEMLGTEQMRVSSFVVPCDLPDGTRFAARWDSTSSGAGSVVNVCGHLFS
jgi:hypothetical protein